MTNNYTINQIITMDDSPSKSKSKKELSKESTKETKTKEEHNYWRSEKGYKRKYQFREKRNYQVCEVCVLLMLLNDYFDIEIVKSTLKKSS